MMDDGRFIAIGGSTGAFQALKTILSGLTADFPAPILLVLHVGEDGGAHLPAILAQWGPLPVHDAQDGAEVHPGQVYLAPAGHHLILQENRLTLGRGPRENLARPSVDALFRSVALDAGPRAIGVVLTGKLDDGAAGLAAIKARGGTTIVQDPVEAVAPDMPRGAMRASEVDYCQPVGQIAALLGHLANEVRGPAGPMAPSWDLELEVDIALGHPCDSDAMLTIADPVALTCPDCGGVLSQMKTGPSRYRRQIGHAYSAQSLADQKEGSVDEAMRMALRVVEERVTLIEQMARDAGEAKRSRSEGEYRRWAAELRSQAAVLRAAALGGRA